VQAREVVNAAQNAAREQGQHLARLQQLGAQQAQHAAQMQQAAAQARDVATRAAAAAAHQGHGQGHAGGAMPGGIPHGAVVHQHVVVAGDDDNDGVPLPVQRPGMSAAESEAVARAQQALSRSRGKSGAAIAEVGSAVFRVEARLDELSKLIRELGSRAQQSAPQAAARGGGGEGHPGLPRFDAVIDQGSVSNFYRWKAGGDVVREGGVFIATYRRPPDIGTRIGLKVTLPGGVDFEATAVVEWARPQGHGPGVQPGFGARFEAMPPQAAPLVIQFANARQPLLFETK
jgi:hypothetical protein